MKTLACLLGLAVAPFMGAATITVHDTGVDSLNALVAAGAQTAFWTLSAEPGGASEAIGSNPFRYHNGAYFADTGVAAWVSPAASGNAGVGGFYTYDLVINLTGLDPTTASITGKLGSDNDASISLNGNAPVLTTGFAAFGTYPSSPNFTFSSGFVAGLNTIHVNLDNGGDPTAFYVEFVTATASPLAGTVPEPGTVSLMCAGFAGLIFVRLRKG